MSYTTTCRRIICRQHHQEGNAIENVEHLLKTLESRKDVQPPVIMTVVITIQ